MTPKTYHLPNGAKIRVSSQRCFILVRDIRGPYIVRRSDNIDNLRRERRDGDFIINRSTGTIWTVMHGRLISEAGR